LVGKSNQLFAALLAHLAEIEARGLHRTRACASLYTYCIYELRFSEDAAARRAGAAKLVKRFPLLLSAIANGELHLTGLLMLGPHLTPENLVEVLGRAKFRTKKELAKLVRELHPLPLVPDLIEPLRPEPVPLRGPTWEPFVASFAPAARELPPSQRPCDWANDAEAVLAAWDEPDPANDAHDEHATGAGHGAVEESAGNGHGAVEEAAGNGGLERVSSESFSPAPARVEPPRVESPPVTAPQQYQLQFSTTEEHVQLIERAKALFARQEHGKSLGELHLRAMRLLVAALEKQKFAVTQGPRKRAASGVAEPTTESAEGRRAAPHQPTATTTEPASNPQKAPHEATPAPTASRGRGRHVPAIVRRAVFERDGGRCTYVDERGERCRETCCLELHHRHPFGKRGTHTAANLTLHCPAHNALAAELDFGLEKMAERRDPLRHESRAAEERAWAREQAQQ